MGETPTEKNLIEAVWRVQDKVPGVIRHMKQKLREGDFKSYVEHLAAVAGCFIGMGQEITDILLTDEEKEGMSAGGIAGAILEDMKRAED